MTESSEHHHDMTDHNATWEGFVVGSIATCVMCAFILVALCSFAFGKTLAMLMGFGGIIVGALVILIDARSGSKTWLLSIGVLVIYGLITAVNVS